MIHRKTLGIVVASLVLGTAALSHAGQPEQSVMYRSPLGVGIAPDGRTIYVAEQSSGTVAVVDDNVGKVTRRLAAPADPADVLLADGQILVGGARGLTLLDPASQAREGLEVGEDVRISALAAAEDGRIALVDNWNGAVLLLDRQNKLLRRWAVDAGPEQAAFTHDGKKLLVTCDGPALPERTVCVIDTSGGQVDRYALPGAALLRGVAVSPDGRFALVAHVRPRANLPATQVAQGWVFTNALTYLPLADSDGEEATPTVSLPLDEPGRFYATPFDVVITPDGKKAYVSHAGADVVSVIDLAALERAAHKLGGEDRAQLGRGENLTLTRQYVKKRIRVGTNPRRMALRADGGELVVANHLGDSLTVIDTASDAVRKTIALGGADAALTQSRRGEVLFNSAGLAFAGQFACASCHPGGGTDGLNWDLPADGIGNFHNSKSLVGVAGTEPYGWLGNSKDFPSRFGGTLRTLFQIQPSVEDLEAIGAYLAQLEPPDLPARVDPASDAARRGREVFEEAGCTDCHRGRRYTDRQLHDVGTAVAGDRSDSFDTPSLVGVSETPPYLHHGRARTLEEVLTRYNPEGRHGGAALLSKEERADLIAFLRSLGKPAEEGDGGEQQTGATSATGVVEGTITYRGVVAKSRVADEAGNRDPLLEVNRENGGLRYVVVYLDPPPAVGKLDTATVETLAQDSEPAVIDQKEYRFVPHLIAVRSGQPVRFTNSDGGNHNIRGAALDPRNQFNVYTGPGNASTQRFIAERRGRPVRVACDIHAWMGAWVYVFDHPYYAVTDADGRFRIEGIPPGRYRLNVVQPDAGISLRQEVTVVEGRTARVDREFSPADTKRR